METDEHGGVWIAHLCEAKPGGCGAGLCTMRVMSVTFVCVHVCMHVCARESWSCLGKAYVLVHTCVSRPGWSHANVACLSYVHWLVSLPTYSFLLSPQSGVSGVGPLCIFGGGTCVCVELGMVCGSCIGGSTGVGKGPRSIYICGEG